ncbi:MAG: non-ribosomal peptide synthetase, partial [Acidobacteria bacterium]|nr:non-ribosomal peptide synthetase [Acidobacteriota bacterium]
EIWRTTFEVINSIPFQFIQPHSDSCRLSFSDLRTVAEADRERQALELATADARPAFNLNVEAPLRARLVTLRDDEHRLFLTAHQIIVDGSTVFDIFPRELTALYESFASGRTSPLPELPCQYRDFCVWQLDKRVPQAFETQIAYWREQLRGELQTLNWPKDRTRPARQSFRGGIFPFQFPRSLTESLKAVSRREGVTLFMTLLAGLVAFLHLQTGQSDIVSGTLGPSGRKRPEFQNLIGYFLNPVLLRMDVSAHPTFRSLLHQARRVVIGAISNDDVSFDVVAEQLRIDRETARRLLFTIALSLAPPTAKLPAGWEMTYMDVESGGSRWDLYVEVSDRPEGMIGRAQYNSDLFSRDQIDRLLREFQILLGKLASDAAQTL